jgi:hypothetical protein
VAAFYGVFAILCDFRKFHRITSCLQQSSPKQPNGSIHS